MTNPSYFLSYILKQRYELSTSSIPLVLCLNSTINPKTSRDIAVMYCEAVQSGLRSKYDLAPDHVPTHPWPYVLASNSK